MNWTYFVPMVAGIPIGVAIGVALVIFVSKSAGPRF